MLQAPTFRRVTLALCLSLFPSLSLAETADNGTDPTRLRNMAWFTYEYMDLGQNTDRDTLKIMSETAFSGTTSLRVTVPVVGYGLPAGVPSGDIDHDLGDIAFRLTHVLDVTPQRGVVLQGEIFTNTAQRPILGYDATVLKATAIYAKFLPGQRIFAPALSHSQSVDGTDVSETVLDLYYVPNLGDPAWYMTIDPAVVYNWESDAAYTTLAVTTGRAVGQFGGGLGQVYIKPNILIGHDRPADWSVEVGFRVLGF